MYFGSFWRTVLFIVRYLNKVNFGKTYIRKVFANSAKHLNIRNS